MTRRVHIIGGGPGGAFAARLLALRHPDWQVRLFEQFPPDDTFGFGVGLTHGLVRSLRAADPQVLDRLMADTFSFGPARFVLPQGCVGFGQFHSGAIRRSTLLRILLDSASEAGAEIVIGEAVGIDEVGAGADLVIAADGLSSPTRTKFEAAFEPKIELGRGAFIWCGGEVELDATVFMPVTTPDGTFVAHAYSYAPGRSAIVIEASQETVDRAGFDQHIRSSGSKSDEAALQYLTEAFALLLQGGKIFGNRSCFGHFNILTCKRWHHDNVVLLGDAAATVHPSLGSGTKVAMESAVALADALDEVGAGEPLSVALPRFEAIRRPKIERLQDAALRSLQWWESFPTRIDMPPSIVAVAYLSRAGVVSLADMAVAEPELTRQAVADFAGVEPHQVALDDVTEWVLNSPLDLFGGRFSRRVVDLADPAAAGVCEIRVDCGDAWGPKADDYVGQAQGMAQRGARLLRLGGANTRSAVLDRLAVAERIRREVPLAVGVTLDQQYLELAAAGLVSGRIDLVWPEPQCD